MKNILPPPVETYLSLMTDQQLESSFRSVYENIMLDTAIDERLTQLGIDLGMGRPPVLFSDDNLWRACIKAVGLNNRHSRKAVVRFVELVLKPRISQGTYLTREVYSAIAIGDSLNITVADPLNTGTHIVEEVLTHHLIFPAGTFGVLPDSPITYNVRGTLGTQGTLITLANGKEALVDTNVRFTNSHPKDFLSNLNTEIPQYGTLIFDKNSGVTPQTTEETFKYEFYDNRKIGFFKLSDAGTSSTITRHQWTSIRSSELSASVVSGALSVAILNSVNFPTSLPLVPAIRGQIASPPGDLINVLPPGSPFAVGGPFLITAVSRHELTVHPGTPFTVPPAPTTTDVLYDIVSAATPGELSDGRGHFLSTKGNILSTTRLVDYSVDFTTLIKPYVTGTTEPFNIIINRGGNNEETLEVLSRVGITLNLVLNPADGTGRTSLLKFDHALGEPVEVQTDKTSGVGSYYRLNAAGATVGTADGLSSTTTLHDLGATFVNENADPLSGIPPNVISFGDELEIVTVPVGNTNIIGDRRTIVLFAGATTLRVDPAFTDTLLGCTYRIRKLYKARPTAAALITNEDRLLYLEDSSFFPAANFSVILDRGTVSEEVVWIDQNDISLNTLRVANSDWGVPGTPNPYLSKDHNFGMTVEAAQVLIEGCRWDVIETRATGEFTVAIEDDCVPPIGVKDAWFIHEETPYWLMDASDFGAEIGAVTGSPPGPTTFIPQAVLAAGVIAGDTEFTISIADFLRVFANKPDEINTKSGKLIFRPSRIEDVLGVLKEEIFLTTVDNFASLSVRNIIAGKTYVITDIPLPTGAARIGDFNSKYPNRAEAISIISSTSLSDGTFQQDLFAPLTYGHFLGESILEDPLTINITRGFKNAYAISSELNLLTALPAYRHVGDITRDDGIASGGGTTYLEDNTKEFHKGLIGKGLYIFRAGAAAPEGERRLIIGVSGMSSNRLLVNSKTPFSAVVSAGDRYLVQPFIQTGDLSDNRTVPFGTVNDAYPADLIHKTANYQKYLGGYKSLFPGSYVYRLLNNEEQDVDQAMVSVTTQLLSAPDTDKPEAIFKFPGPRRLIAPPLIPYGLSRGGAVLDGSEIVLDPVDIGANDPTGHAIEILDFYSRDYRKTTKIVSWDAVNFIATLDPPFKDPIPAGIPYRIFGIGDALNPLTPVSGNPYFWVDYPEYFPETPQGSFEVTIDRQGSAEDAIVNLCINTLGANYGRFTLEVEEAISFTHWPGESLELKISKIALDSVPSSAPSIKGGFYVGFGFEEEKFTDSSIGLGTDDSLHTLKYVGGVHAPTHYSHNGTPGADNTIMYGKYSVPTEGLNISTPLEVIARIRVSEGNPLGSTVDVLRPAELSFDTQKYKSYLGAHIVTAATALVSPYIDHVITDINSATNDITVSPALPSPLAQGDTFLIITESFEVDDHEPLTDIDDFLAIKETATGLDNVLFPTLTIDGASPTVLQCNSNAPFSTALIGKQISMISGATSGESSNIVNIGESVPGTYDQLILSPALSVGPGVGDQFIIIPNIDLYEGVRDMVGGVYTGINYPNPPLNSTTRYPAKREYGIVEEYIEYQTRDGNIFTLADPFYPKYDHPPNSRVFLGSGITITEGTGKDYRPYITKSYLELLFNSSLVDIKNLFCAAGIQCKTENTELGS